MPLTEMSTVFILKESGISYKIFNIIRFGISYKTIRFFICIHAAMCVFSLLYSNTVVKTKMVSCNFLFFFSVLIVVVMFILFITIVFV